MYPVVMYVMYLGQLGLDSAKSNFTFHGEVSSVKAFLSYLKLSDFDFSNNDWNGTIRASRGVQAELSKGHSTVQTTRHAP